MGEQEVIYSPFKIDYSPPPPVFIKLPSATIITETATAIGTKVVMSVSPVVVPVIKALIIVLATIYVIIPDMIAKSAAFIYPYPPGSNQPNKPLLYSYLYTIFVTIIIQEVIKDRVKIYHLTTPWSTPITLRSFTIIPKDTITSRAPSRVYYTRYPLMPASLTSKNCYFYLFYHFLDTLTIIIPLIIIITDFEPKSYPRRGYS